MKKILIYINDNSKGRSGKTYGFFHIGNNDTFILSPIPMGFNYPFSLRKHAYQNILKILPPKNENFQIKNSDIFYISAQNIDCGQK